MKKTIIITILLTLVMAPLGMEAKKKAKTVEVPDDGDYKRRSPRQNNGNGTVP